MYKVIFTSDYELHDSGKGSPRELLVEPTARMLEQFDRYGAKLTLMAEAAEILKFKQYAELHGDDRFQWRAIEAQLRRIVRTGHDVQLRLRPSWFDATWDEQSGAWMHDHGADDLAALPYSRVRVMIRSGKRLLDDTCRAASPTYACFAFRAASWSRQPSTNVVRALIDEGFTMDTSVWQGGRADDLVRFDYSRAHSAVVPWPVNERNVCTRDPDGALFEVPIYAERRPFWAFVTANRLYRAVAQQRALPPPNAQPRRSLREKLGAKASTLLRAHPWRMDFNEHTGKALVRALRRAEARHGHPEVPLPFVLVGRSRTFTKRTERVLLPFLEYVAEHPERYAFATFGDLDLERYRSLRAPRHAASVPGPARARAAAPAPRDEASVTIHS